MDINKLPDWRIAVATEVAEDARLPSGHQAKMGDLVVVVTMTRDEDEMDMEFAGTGPTPVELLLSGADAHSVRQCVDGLEGGQKQAIALAFFQGLSHGEVAEHLQQPLGTVKSWVRRGLDRLKKCLEGAGFAA